MILTINERSIAAPDWNALPLRDALTAYHLIVRTPARPQAIRKTQLQLLKLICQLDDEVLEAYKRQCHEQYGLPTGSDVYWYTLNECLKIADKLWLVEETKAGLSHQPRFGLTRCPFPVLELPSETVRLPGGQRMGQRRRYFAAADGLENVTFHELIALFSLIESWQANNDSALVSRLLATVYRPGKLPTRRQKQAAYDGDRRVSLAQCEATTAHRAQEMARLPEWVQGLLLFWLVSCREAIVAEYEALFSGGRADGEGGGWSVVLLELAGRDLSKLDAVAEQPYQNAFLLLRELKRAQLEQLARRARP